jgi:hypothetical protein
LPNPEIEDSVVELFVGPKLDVVVVKVVLLVVAASSAATGGTAVKPIGE